MEMLTKRKESEKLMRNLAINIRKYRKQNNITQEKLADDVEISREYLRRLETTYGKEGLSLVNIYRISKTLDVTIDDLIKDNE